jgi:methylenetetrahydrofolate dehydrogenase (NADP+)/methenyltetrahydrofolate cyclohydrolase
LEKDDSQYEQKLKSADIAVVATGGGRRFSSPDFKSGATVIDASTIAEEGKVKGDVEAKNWPEDINLAPVPGGVGPVTVAMLYQNFYNLIR